MQYNNLWPAAVEQPARAAAPMRALGPTLLATLSLFCAPALRAEAPQDTPATEPPLVEELVVVAKLDRRTYELAETLNIAPDSAALLKRAVGANVVSNGPISGMAQ